MTPKTINEAITRTTERAFGRSINPHLFRDCAATFVALEDPLHVGIVAPLLGHLDARTAERHYIQANQIVAGRRVRDSVAAMRKRLAKAHHGRPS
jgi:integrase/recombinase XerD